MFDQARVMCRAFDKPCVISFRLYYTAFWHFLHIIIYAIAATQRFPACGSKILTFFVRHFSLVERKMTHLKK